METNSNYHSIEVENEVKNNYSYYFPYISGIAQIDSRDLEVMTAFWYNVFVEVAVEKEKRLVNIQSTKN